MHRTVHDMVQRGEGVMPWTLAKKAGLKLALRGASVPPGFIRGRRTPAFAVRPGAEGFDLLKVQGENGLAVPRRWTLTPPSGDGSGNAMQGIAIDEVNRLLYVQHSHEPSGNAFSVIGRYPLDTSGTVASNARQSNTQLIGHQGITVEQATGKLWSGGPVASGTYGPAWVFRFNFVASGAPANGQYYRVFPTGPVWENPTPTISYDQKYLVVFAAINNDDNTLDQFFVRIFDLAAMIAGGPGDYSSAYLSEFSYLRGSDLNYLNGLAADENCVYLHHGNGTPGSTQIMKFSFAGELLQAGKNTRVGLNDLSGDSLEPEGMAFMKVKPSDLRPSLVMAYAAGVSGARTRPIYVVS